MHFMSQNFRLKWPWK